MKQPNPMKPLLTTLILFLLAFTINAQEQKQTENNSKKPKATYQVGSAKVVVWENKMTGKNGEFTAKNFKVEKTYQKDGEWKTTNSFNEEELLQLKAAIDKAILEENVKTTEGTEKDTN
ncbi:MAG: hypothetical protein A2033_12815 [Bacteroidetes bacterium GWA2_31_9]|nr:MAG: hypothetical protein A2033_12815 [Bacteroidetes bacterium GWA2_31_9]